MTKSKAFSFIILAVILSVLVNVFFGRLLTAKISTLPVMNRFKLLSPQAPIVITQREEIRVTDTGDAVQAMESVRSKLSSVMVVTDKKVSFAATAINVTSDGIFIVPKAAIGTAKAENLVIELNDGTTQPVVAIENDPATSIAVLQTKNTNVSAAGFADSSVLTPAQKIILVKNSVVLRSVSLYASSITAPQYVSADKAHDADMPVRSFDFVSTSPVSVGTVAVNSNGEVLGLWDGAAMVSADVLKELINNYLSTNHTINRGHFGFTYQAVPPVESKLFATIPGARVVAVTATGPAQKAGLAENDIITAVNGQAVDASHDLETILQKFHAGDIIKVTVQRGVDSKVLDLTVTKL